MEKLLTDEPEPGALKPAPALSASLVTILGAPLPGVAPVSDVLLVPCALDENVPLVPPSDGLRPEPVMVCAPMDNPGPVPRAPEEAVLEKEVEPPREGLVTELVPDVLLVIPEPVLGNLDEPVLE